MSDHGFTRAVPMSDGPMDDIVAQIEAMIDRRIQRLYGRLATVSRVNAGTGLISVTFHDDDFEGQQTKARTAGVAYDVGDVVLCQPVSETEWVVTQKMISNNQDRRAVSHEEIRNNAIRTDHVQNSAITSAKLSENYTPAAQFASTVTSLNNAISNRATTAYVDNQVATRQPIGNYPTAADVNQALRSKADAVHRHDASEIQLMNAAGMTTPMLRLRDMVRCHYQNRSKSGNPCGSQLQNLNNSF